MQRITLLTAHVPLLRARWTVYVINIAVVCRGLSVCLQLCVVGVGKTAFSLQINWTIWDQSWLHSFDVTGDG